jgi:hypothetical protein
MAFEDRMQRRMERQRERDARNQGGDAERDARNQERDAERLARRLSRMADQPLRTPSMPPMIDNRPTMPPMIDNRPMPRSPARQTMPESMIPSGRSAGFFGGDFGGGIGSLFGGGTNALTIMNPNRFPQQQMPQPDQSYGSWLSSQLRNGVDFERMGVDPMQIYNQSLNQPIPQIPWSDMTQLGQMPTQPGGKGGQMPTQPGGKGAANPAMGAGLSALGLFR